MKKDLWAVMCGTIRDELDFKLSLSKLIDLRNKDKIQHIVLSTWKGEIDQYNGLRDILDQLQVILFETPVVAEELQNSGTQSVNLWRQAKQILYALDKIPSDSFILRLRTDRSLNYLNHMEKEKIFDEKNYQIEAIQYGKFPKLFDYKVLVYSPKMVRILHMIDFVFLGYHKDLYKMINFDVCELSFERSIVANAQWFMQPFLKEFPVLRSYMSFTNFNNTNKVLKHYVDEHKDQIELPNVYYKVYAIYLLILYTHFKILCTGKVDDTELADTSFYHFFTSSPKKHLATTNLGTSVRNEKILSYAIFGKLKPSQSYSHFLEYVREIVAYGNSHKFSYSHSDRIDLERYVKACILGDNISIKWYRKLSNRPVNPKISYRNTSYNTNLLNCLNIEEKLWESLYQTSNIEKDLLNKWLEVDKPNPSTTELMLLPIARSGNEYAIYILLDLYYMGRLSAKYENEVIRISEFFLNIYINKKTYTEFTLLLAYLYQMCVETGVIDQPKIDILELYTALFEKYEFNIKIDEILLLIFAVSKETLNLREKYYADLVLSKSRDIVLSDNQITYKELMIERIIRIREYVESHKIKDNLINF